MPHDTATARPWICAQIGAREHYAIPRVLARRGKLERLLTDYWRAPGQWHVPGAPRRWHPELGQARVSHLNWRALAWDGRGRLRDPWEAILARNAAFQCAHLKILQRQRECLQRLPPGVFFAYSYAARELLAFFRDLGWKTLLGQIDPGPREAAIVNAEIIPADIRLPSWRPPPQRYWDTLRAEQELADWILVNSEWSRQLCLEAGVNESRLRILPLAYAPDAEAGRVPEKHYPRRFDARRPLRVLFLGQICVRKGVHHLLESLRQLAAEPLELWLAGSGDLRLGDDSRIRRLGLIPRERTARCYREADVFILPTLSDGFAITQLEAQYWRLPIIASRHCAEVVHDGVNGLILDPVGTDSISVCLRRCLREPGLLEQLSRASRVAEAFSLEALEANLNALEA